MGKLPKIRILPDQTTGRDDELGQVLEFEVDASDTAIRARVKWTELASFRHSRTRDRVEWLPVDQLEPIPGEVYTGVTRTLAGNAAPVETDDDAPEDWPAGVPTPSTPGWEKAAVNWLFEQLPPGYRSHEVLRENPAVLVQMARTHLRLVYTEVVRGYRTSAVQLKGELPPHAVREVDEVYRLERERIIRCGKAVDAVEKALDGGA